MISHSQSTDKARIGKKTCFSAKTSWNIYLSPPLLLCQEYTRSLPCGLPASHPALLQSFFYLATTSIRWCHFPTKRVQWLPTTFSKKFKLLLLYYKASHNLVLPSSPATLPLITVFWLPWLTFSSKASSSFLAMDTHAGCFFCLESSSLPPLPLKKSHTFYKSVGMPLSQEAFPDSPVC